MLISVIWKHVCFVDTVVADRDFEGTSQSGTGCCVISVVDALVFGQCVVSTSGSGGFVVIYGSEVTAEVANHHYRGTG